MQPIKRLAPLPLRRENYSLIRRSQFDRSYWFVPFIIVPKLLKEEAIILSKISAKEFAIHDGTKIVGYAAYGHYFNLKGYYT